MPTGLYPGANSATGNGVTVSFAYSYRILDEADLRVTVDGVLKVLTTDYTVSGVDAANGGNVVFAVAPANGAAIVIERVREYKRDTDYQRNGSFDEETVDADFDALVMLIQQVEAIGRRAFKAPVEVVADQVISDADYAARAGTVFGFDALGAFKLLAGQAGSSLVNLAASAGASLIGFIASGANAILRSVQAKLREIPSTADYGASSSATGAENAAALTLALVAHDEFKVTAGTYDLYEIAASNKTLRMERGVTFKVPDDTVVALDTTGPAGLKVSGDNVDIYGDFTIDGNAANNDASSFPTSERVGALFISGDNVRIHDTVHLLNPYYAGLQVDGGDTAGNEVAGTYIKRVKITNPVHYATFLWSMDGWEIGTLEVVAGANGTDQRVRTGTASSPTAECKNGVIHRINSQRSVVVEAKTNGLALGKVRCKAFKAEDAFGIRWDTLDIYDAGDSQDAYGFAILDADNIQGGDVLVSDYNGTGSGRPVWISETETTDIKSIVVKGTIANVTDFTIRSADGLNIGLVECKDPVGTGAGFLFDYDPSHAPQQNIRIGAIFSDGHTGADINIEDNASVDFLVQYIEGTTVSGTTRRVTHQFIQDKAVTFAAGSGTITVGSQNTIKEVKTGRLVTISGRLTVSGVSAPSGALSIAGLTYAPSADTDLATEVAVAITAQGMVSALHTVQAFIAEGSTSITIQEFDGTTVQDMADHVGTSTVFRINASYLTD